MISRRLAAAQVGQGGLSLSSVLAAHLLKRTPNVGNAALPRRNSSFYSRAHLGLDDLERRRAQLAKRYTKPEVEAIRSQASALSMTHLGHNGNFNFVPL